MDLHLYQKFFIFFLIRWWNGLWWGGTQACVWTLLGCLPISKLIPIINNLVSGPSFLELDLLRNRKKNPPDMKGKDVDLSGTFLRIFPTPIHGYSYYFYISIFLFLLVFTVYWCKQSCSICCFPPYSVSFPYNSHKLLPVKNVNNDQNQQKFLPIPSVGFRWAIFWATCVPFCLWSRPCAFREKKNTHRTRFLDI